MTVGMKGKHVMVNKEIEEDFVANLIGCNPLNIAVGFINENLEPDDVFDIDYLVDWVIENKKDYIENIYNPEDVFSDEKLDVWAATHGYVSE